MRFLGFSDGAVKAIDVFNRLIRENPNGHYTGLIQRLNRCSADVIIIFPDLPPIKLSDSGEYIYSLHQALSILRESTFNSDQYLAAHSEILNYCQPLSAESRLSPEGIEISLFQPLMRVIGNDIARPYVLFLKGTEESGLPLYFLNLITQIYQIEQNIFPIHSCCVTRQGKNFLFSGPSGAGKSTIAELSADLNYQIVDEEQVIISKDDTNQYSACGWGNQMLASQAPIQAIFILNKNEIEYIRPMAKKHLAKQLIERHIDVVDSLLPQDLLANAFTMASDIARSVPGYELHFRKSPDFWKLIDAEFPD